VRRESGWLLAGRYQLLERIGKGGAGVVWRALDTELDREVAVKELRLPEWIEEHERRLLYARMEREARAAARLRHPSIVTIHDRIPDEDRRPWIVMELIQGTSLADLLKRHGRLPVRQVADIGLRILEAVSLAHANGIIHRDIKPSNVLLEGNRVVLTDFGIAALEGDRTLTRTGATLGTPAYMPPEQVNGGSVPQSDLWSLGATLYDAVEGHPPFDGPTEGALYAAIATQGPAPFVHAGPLAPALHGLLRKSPTERLTVEEVRDLLTPLTATPQSSGQDDLTQQNRPAGKTFAEGDPRTSRAAHSDSGQNSATPKAQPRKSQKFAVRPPIFGAIMEMIVGLVLVIPLITELIAKNLGYPDSLPWRGGPITFFLGILGILLSLGLAADAWDSGAFSISQNGLKFSTGSVGSKIYSKEFEVAWSEVASVALAAPDERDSRTSVIVVSFAPDTPIYEKHSGRATVRRIKANSENLRDALRGLAPEEISIVKGAHL
jgi:serine/threonine protein kinase